MRQPGGAKCLNTNRTIINPKAKTIIASQYGIVAARRQNFDTMLWQTPVLSLTAQAFLFTIALGHDSERVARFVSASLAFIAAVASIQLMAKHRFHEVEDAKRLSKFEKNNGYQRIHKRRKVPIEGPMHKKLWLFFVGRSFYGIWIGMLSLFALASAYIMIQSCLDPTIFRSATGAVDSNREAVVVERILPEGKK